MKSKIFVFTTLLVFFCAAFLVSDGNAQTRRTKTKKPKPVATPTPTGEATIISLASQNNEQNTAVTTNNQTVQTENTTQTETQTSSSNTESNTLEPKKKLTKEEKQKQLLMNLEILSKAEQRAELLRKQLFDLLEKQYTLQAKIDQIIYDLRPDSIERYAATIGSLRPESIREARKTSLENEKRNLESLLTQVTNSRSSLEQTVQRADLMVDKLREKLEKEIDDAIEDKEN